MKIRKIAISKLRENPWNPNRMDESRLSALRRVIAEKGFVQPLLVRPHPEKKGGYEILDGAHRFRVLRELGRKEAECVVVNDADGDAVLRTLAMNRLRGCEDPDSLASAVAGAALADEVLAKYLAFDEGEIAAMREMLSPPPELNLEPEEEYVLLDFYLTAGEADYVKGVLGRAIGNDGERESGAKAGSAIPRARRDAIALMTVMREYESDFLISD